MSANLWPADAVSGAPVYNGRALRQTTMAVLAALSSTSRPLGGKSGIRPGTPASIVSVSSTSWSVSPFAGLIDGEASSVAGPYGYSFDSTQTGAVTAAGSAARVDRLDVQVSDPAEGDGSSTPGISVVYTKGAATGGATPAAPARSHRLCLINVPASGGGSPSVTWAPDWTAAVGAPWMVNTQTELPGSTSNIPVNQRAMVLADPLVSYNSMWMWSGTAWLMVDASSPITSMGANWSGLTGPEAPSVTLSRGRVYLDGALRAASGASGSSMCTVPVAFQPPTTATRFIGTTAGSAGGTVYPLTISAGLIQIPSGYGIGSLGAGTVLPLAGLSYTFN